MATVRSCDFRTARVGGVHCTMPRRRENWGWLAFSLFRLTVHTCVFVCVCMPARMCACVCVWGGMGVSLANLSLTDRMACEQDSSLWLGSCPMPLRGQGDAKKKSVCVHTIHTYIHTCVPLKWLCPCVVSPLTWWVRAGKRHQKVA